MDGLDEFVGDLDELNGHLFRQLASGLDGGGIGGVGRERKGGECRREECRYFHG
jgi:hypothetical protein